MHRVFSVEYDFRTALDEDLVLFLYNTIVLLVRQDGIAFSCMCSNSLVDSKPLIRITQMIYRYKTTENPQLFHTVTFLIFLIFNYEYLKNRNHHKLIKKCFERKI